MSAFSTFFFPNDWEIINILWWCFLLFLRIATSLVSWKNISTSVFSLNLCCWFKTWKGFSTVFSFCLWTSFRGSSCMLEYSVDQWVIRKQTCIYLLWCERETKPLKFSVAEIFVLCAGLSSLSLLNPVSLILLEPQDRQWPRDWAWFVFNPKLFDRLQLFHNFCLSSDSKQQSRMSSNKLNAFPYLHRLSSCGAFPAGNIMYRIFKSCSRVQDTFSLAHSFFPLFIAFTPQTPKTSSAFSLKILSCLLNFSFSSFSPASKVATVRQASKYFLSVWTMAFAQRASA